MNWNSTFKSAVLRTETKVSVKRKCKVCRSMFDPSRPSQIVCEAPNDCAEVFADQVRSKVLRANAKRDAADLRTGREAFKSIPDLKADAQVAFNAFIRYRDDGLPCICCGNFPKTTHLTGGVWDAGHYRSRGSADHMRYIENNVHRQLKSCNKYGATDYRGGLIARIGLPAVEALEAENTVIKWTADMLRAIKAEYALKLKKLKLERGE
jgi:hypothetical protein